MELNILHQNILRIAQSLRKKQRGFNMLTLFEKCCRELPNPEPEIDHALRELYQMHYLVEGKQYFRDEILENEKRKQIYDYLLKYPGAHERELRKIIGLGAYEVQIHLSFLTLYGFIRSSSYKNKSVYFLIDFDSVNELNTLILRNETTQKIYDCIASQHQLRLSEIAELLPFPYTTIQPHVKELIDGGLINKIEKDGISYYTLAEISLQKEVIELKRDYDYIGGQIRFKIAVRNLTSMAIHNIGVNINPSEQFRTDVPQQTISNLPPNETRGIDFYLTPLTCGQSTVFGSISFQDAYGDAHSLTIQPKEISIKCPLVQPQPATQSEVDEWIKTLKRGTSRINYHSISDAEAFRIGREQVSALDLNEITSDSLQMSGLYSGNVKVTGKNMVVKVSVANPDILVDVWAEDLKQTTGFLAYLSNLINISLEIAYKMAKKTQDISQKIINLMKISNLLDESVISCKGVVAIHEITDRLLTLQQLFQNTLPDSTVISSIKMWNSKFISQFDPASPLELLTAIELQYEIIKWYYKIQEQISSHMQMYQETFNDLNYISDEFSVGLQLINERIQEHERDYGLRILAYLMIIDKKSGVVLFEKNITNLHLDPDLIGGFLHALQSFGMEIAASETSMKTLSYESYQFQIETGDYTRVALIIRGTPNQYLITKLNEFTTQFEQAFNDQIQHFSGHTKAFEAAEDLVELIFK